MSDERTTVVETAPAHSGALLGAIAVAVLAALGGLVWSYTLNNRIARQETALSEANQQSAKLDAQLRETNARLRVATDELEKSVGMTQKQLDARAQDIIAREAAENRKLENAQKQTAQQVNAVQSDVSSVKTDVGGVKTDLTKTQTDLATTISQLTSMKGDLDSHSSLIARNASELDLLKHKGDRNYYEFTLTKGQKKPVGTVSLELKKADAKKSRFTIEVYADDKQYDKKDRNVNETLQFYAGKDPALYEIVVNTVSAKNTVSGYLSTPKGAPAPPNVQ
jgi:phage shock protein A